MVKPIRVLLLLFYIACITAVIMILSPGEVQLTDTISFNVFSTSDLYTKEEKQTDISEIIKLQDHLDSLGKIQEKQFIQDSINASLASSDSGQVERYEPVTDTKYPIQYPDSTNYVLDSFFASLKDLHKTADLLRIVHYGDSQIEGDRISDYLRSRFQNKFGGCGVGLVPPIEKQASRSTLSTDFASNWDKYAINGNISKTATRHYGLLGAYYRFSPASKKDSMASPKTYRSWVRYKETPYTKGQKSTHIENVKILYATPDSRLATDISVDNDTTISNFFEIKDSFSVHEQPLEAKFKNLKINFESAGGSELYGIAFDCDKGVAVDNVALRGSSGVEFTKMDKNFVKRHIEKMNVKLLILQFGVNVVPNVLKDYTFYEDMFYKQLIFLKSLSPDLNILVVGVSDMSRRQGTSYGSYPNIPKVREAQRRAAFRANCAFWDLYEAMGGQNSMQSWAHAKPSLAAKDYIHFNARGARLVGEMLYNAIIKEYDNYKKRNG